jgi:hypothetical protein
LLQLDGVAGLDQQLDDGHVLEVADVGHAHFDRARSWQQAPQRRWACRSGAQALRAHSARQVPLQVQEPETAGLRPQRAASSTSTTEPCLTLSPILTRSSFTTPAAAGGDFHRRLVGLHGDQRLLGLDGVAGLDQQFDHRHFVEVADVGTLTSINAMLLSPCSGVQRVDLVGLDAVLGIASATLAGHRALIAQRLQGGHHDVVAVDLEVLAQLAAEVAAAKAVGAQHLVGTALGDERTDLLGVGFM